MKKIYCIGMVLLTAITHSQKLFITKTANENSNFTNYFSRINTADGSILNDYNTPEPGYYDTGGPIFDSQTNSIYTFKGNKLFKYDIGNLFDSTSFGGSIGSVSPFAEIILINNRLFATKIYNLTGFDYQLTICELNKENGSLIQEIISPVTIATNGYGSAFSNTANELFVVVGNKLIKHNIVTNARTTFTLEGNDLNTFYGGVIFAQNRLFVRKRDYLNNQARNYIVEINKDTGVVMATYPINSSDEPTNNLVFLASSHEIAGLFYTSDPNVKKILKFNIDTHTETWLNLPDEIASPTVTQYYRQLVSIDSEELLGTSQFQQNSETKIKAVFNLLGQKVPMETFNQVLIVEYENGTRVKKINTRN